MAADANAIRAGAAYVRLFVQDNITKPLNDVGRRFQSWGASITRFGARVFAAGAAGATAMLGLVASFAATGSELARVAQRTGITVEALSELKYAAEQNGVSFEQLQDGLKGMTQFLGQVRGRGAEAMLALAQLGVSADELNGMSADQAMEHLGAAISRIPDPTRQAALAMRVFGEAGGRLLPLFANGADALRRAREEARALGVTMSGPDAQAAVALTQAWSRLLALLNAAKDAIGAALAPVLTDLLDIVTGFVRSVVSWIQQNRELARSVLLGVVVVAAIGAGLVALGVTLGVIGAAFTALATIVTTAIGAVVGIVTFLLSPLGLVLAAVAALTAAWLAWTESGQRTLSSLSATFAEWSSIAQRALGAVWNALRSGNLQAAGEIIVSVLRLAWLQVVHYFSQGWRSLRDEVLEIWDGITDSIARGMIKAWGIVRRVWYSGLTGLGAFMQSVREGNSVAVSAARAGRAAVQRDNEIANDGQIAGMLNQVNEMARQRRNRRANERATQTAEEKAREQKERFRMEAAIAAGNAAQPQAPGTRAKATVGPGRIDTTPTVQASAPLGTFSAIAAQGMFGGAQLQRRMANGIDQVAANTAAINTNLTAALRYS